MFLVFHLNNHFRVTLLLFNQGQVTFIKHSTNVLVRMFAHNIKGTLYITLVIVKEKLLANRLANHCNYKTLLYPR